MTTHLLPDEQHLQELEAAAPVGPWSIDPRFRGIFAGDGICIADHDAKQDESNRAFVVASRNMTKTLLERIAALREKIEELEVENERLQEEIAGEDW